MNYIYKIKQQNNSTQFLIKKQLTEFDSNITRLIKNYPIKEVYSIELETKKSIYWGNIFLPYTRFNYCGSGRETNLRLTQSMYDDIINNNIVLFCADKKEYNQIISLYNSDVEFEITIFKTDENVKLHRFSGNFELIKEIKKNILNSLVKIQDFKFKKVMFTDI